MSVSMILHGISVRMGLILPKPLLFFCFCRADLLDIEIFCGIEHITTEPPRYSAGKLREGNLFERKVQLLHPLPLSCASCGLHIHIGPGASWQVHAPCCRCDSDFRSVELLPGVIMICPLPRRFASIAPLQSLEFEVLAKAQIEKTSSYVLDILPNLPDLLSCVVFINVHVARYVRHQYNLFPLRANSRPRLRAPW